MTPQLIEKKLWNWASHLDENTAEQAARTARLDVVYDHIALMPDAHFGRGSTVGSVIPTENAILPAAVGVDIGCGMIAVELDMSQDQLPDDLDKLLPKIGRAVPAGMGKGHKNMSAASQRWLEKNPNETLTPELKNKTCSQFGTLGSGNHFFEICTDNKQRVWVVLHSGSRGIGNILAKSHIKIAQKVCENKNLEDKDLAYFTQGTPEFGAYIQDMFWAQEYAMANRQQMMSQALWTIKDYFGFTFQMERTINCHHNYTEQEEFDGKSLWITRKGAIKAEIGDLGVIPGSMGTQSFIVKGKGNPLSWNSCSHGAGRKMSRNKAKSMFNEEDLQNQMRGKTWLKRDAGRLIDEIPSSYKDINEVMADQTDLVEIVAVLEQVLNYKGC